MVTTSRWKDLLREPTVFLIPQYSFDEEAAEWLKSAYGPLFEYVLWEYYTDESLWPHDRSYETFCRWFDYSVHSWVIDLEDAPLIREDE